MQFKIIGEIDNIEIIAVGNGIRDITRLKEQYGAGHWRKLKGIATVELITGHIRQAEIHWYEKRTVSANESLKSNIF